MKVGHEEFPLMARMSDAIGKALVKNESKELHWVYKDGTDLFTAITGNGPTSKANAEFIAAANPHTIMHLIRRIRRLEKREELLIALENGGVDNWEWYSESIKNYEELKKDLQGAGK